MTPVLDTLVPVFAIVALAMWLGRRGLLTKAFMDQLNWLIFWVSLPALILHSLITTESLPPDTLPILLIFITSTLTVTALAFPVCWLLKLPRARIGTFVQASYRGNLAYTGLPILIFAMHGQTREAVADVVAQSIFILAPTMLLYNVMAVILLVGSKEGFSPAKLGSMALKVVGNPLIIASVVGAVLFALQLKIPTFVINTLDLAGQMAAPAALFCVGGTTAFVSMHGRYRSATAASLLKCAALPAVAAALAAFFPLDPNARLVLLVLSACPTAVASYVMAKELNGDEALAAGTILISTTICIPGLALIIHLA